MVVLCVSENRTGNMQTAQFRCLLVRRHTENLLFAGV